MSSPAIKESVPPAKPLIEQPGLAPEGGTRGWLCVTGAFLGIFCTFGFLNAIGLFQTTYQETSLSEYTPSEISWIFATQLALMWAPGPIFGRLIDTFGPAPVLYPSSLLCVFSLCMTSLADKYYQIFLAQGLAFGIGAGGVSTTSMVCVGQWHIRRRALAIGIATAGSSVGGIIFPIFFDRVMQRVGFQGAIRYTALLIGILLAASCFLITSRLPRKKWDWEAKWFDLALFKERQFALFTIGAYFTMWTIFAPLTFLPGMALEQGFSASLAIYLLSIINATSVFGRTILPYFADQIGSFNIVTMSAGMSGVCMLALWLPFNHHHSHAGIIVFALAYGFFSGAFISLLMPCVVRAGNIQTLGRRFGTFQIIMSISNLTGLPLMGAILNRQGNHDFSGLTIFAGVSCLLGSIVLTAATYFLGKTQGSWKV
ncbi:MFS general substrate transporter [Dothidotthia symphoricarpi CBS 119687]|uniref:MFS general substrate transporter n=1 Tax=Dothidotthia symphoricarpi CBS 119687 TaxID=1392245 RepID=A0A6A6AVY4_9PLEO|nr:MFS general substrate transporter [Dothidotthia symphoricarpi CBS 119687]KAF2134691.1 MFS general substrate transporter [Dothidotthia symphoricarpi CBS 119687]